MSKAEQILLKRVATLEERVSALELVAQRYADIKPKLDQIHAQLNLLAPIVKEYMEQKKGDKLGFSDEVKLN